MLGIELTPSLCSVVEATLAIILLKKCELRLLQSTVVGVVILHLLLVPVRMLCCISRRLSSENPYWYERV